MSTNQTIERTALGQLVSNEEFARKALPHMKGDYFSDKTEKTIFEEITKFVDKYNKIPTQTSLEIEVQSRKDLNEEEYKKVVAVIQTLESTDVDFDWLVDTTEQFVKIRRYIMRLLKAYKSLMEKIRIEMYLQYQVFSQMPLLWVSIMLLALSLIHI